MVNLKEAWKAAGSHIGINERSDIRWVMRHLKLKELQNSSLPILTASVIGTFEERIDRFPLVMSRAHLSQSLAFSQLFEQSLPVADLANYLEFGSLQKMIETTIKGRLVARNESLSNAYKLMTPILRRLLPIDKGFRSICEIFAQELSKNQGRPIVTFHYGVGNAVIESLKKRKTKTTPVIHYVTDPYVHKDYLKFKDQPYVYYFVFNEATKFELEKNGVKPERIFITGFPVNRNLDIDLDINGQKIERYKLGSGKKLKIAVFTGGTGSNQDEIAEIAKSFDYAKQSPVFYCGTNYDLAEKLRKILESRKITPFVISENQDNLEVDSNSQATIIVGKDLSQLLPISYQIINWSQVVVTKPSGDIGLESLLAGKPMIVLKEWGQHEVNIHEIIKDYNGEIKMSGGLKNIGRELKWQGINDRLYNQVKNMWQKLNTKPPFPLNWEKNVKQALELI